MKIRTRIATAVTVALATVLVSAPAFASEGVEKVDTHAPFSAAGQPVDVVAISIVGVVLLGIVLITSTLLGNLFEKNKKKA
ncbi:hypothetical protein [Leucobacter sp. G161]|uniref:hypothetical protein n=1 Tax=Leucobacter sp. G161 TaxID=663704 RepID=UPI00073AF35B|nr:hypothetical protein [Leucobacter sp. G161]KUF08424.1 hypothetical protein AUL38_04720 [Leucobacter sp. G161]